MKKLAFCLLLLWMIGTLAAQDAASRYFWETAGVSIPVPQGWAAPLPLEQNGAPVLLLKPALTGSEASGSVSIQFKLLPLPENPDDLAPLLKTEFEAMNLRLAVTQPVLWLDRTAFEGFGTDETEILYGRGRAVALETQVLVMMTSGPLETLNDLNALVLDEAFATSMSDVDPGMRPYGVLWQHISTGADGEQAFIQPQSIAANNNGVYVADRLNGVLLVSRLSSDVAMPVTSTSSLTGIDVAESPDAYGIDNESCACLTHLYGPDVIMGEGFAPTAPSSLATGAEGWVFATDIGPDGLAFVRTFYNDVEQAPLLFETPLTSQPRLFATPDVLYALTETGDLLKQEGAGFSTVGTLPVTSARLLKLWDNDTFLMLDDSGLLSLVDITGQMTPFSLAVPSEASLVDVAVSTTTYTGVNKTLYTLEQMPDSSVLTAWGQGTVAYGIGREWLLPFHMVIGRFEGTDRHVWMIPGHAGDVVDLTAELSNPDDTLIMELQLLDSSGTVLGSQTLTNAPTTPTSISLEKDGLYFLVVNRVNGSVEQYKLGFRPTYLLNPLSLPEDTRTRNYVSQAVPIQRYSIPLTAGLTFTAHVTAISGTLDPSLRLVNPRGDEVGVNEDLDPSLGVDAELTQIQISNNGNYILEVRATSGEGDYELNLTIED